MSNRRKLPPKDIISFQWTGRKCVVAELELTPLEALEVANNFIGIYHDLVQAARAEQRRFERAQEKREWHD